jgi:LacI family transcriptional regulator
MRARATMREVAALAGVGIKTVSRVVNGEPGVSEETESRVQAAIERLDYRHNLAASHLRRGHRTSSVGVLLQDVSNSFSGALLRSVEDVARERGVVVLSASLDESEERERRLVRDFMSRRIDGLLVMPASHDHAYLQNDLRAGVAIVLVDRPTRRLDADTVLVDNRGGARAAVDHLLRQGHRRVAFVGDVRSIATATERHEGYIEAIQAAGLSVDQSLVHFGLRTSDAARAGIAAMLCGDDPPTAVFGGRNEITVGAVQALRELGLSHRVALVGFDDFPMSDLLDPPVTVVRQEVGRVGRTAAELLFARMDGDDSATRRVVLPAVLVPRGSGEIPPQRQ